MIAVPSPDENKCTEKMPASEMLHAMPVFAKSYCEREEKSSALSISVTSGLSGPHDSTFSLPDTKSISLGLSTTADNGLTASLDEDSIDELMDEGLIQDVIEQYLATDAFSCIPVSTTVSSDVHSV